MSPGQGIVTSDRNRFGNIEHPGLKDDDRAAVRAEVNDARA